MGAGYDFTKVDSWVVGLYFVMFAILSILSEKGLHHLHHHLHHNHKHHMLHLLDRLKEELMLLGLVRLFLLAVEEYMVTVCVSKDILHPHTWSLCYDGYAPSVYDDDYKGAGAYDKGADSGYGDSGSSGSYYPPPPPYGGSGRRLLGSLTEPVLICPYGETQLVSAAAMHQVDVLIFLMGVMHVTYGGATLVLGHAHLQFWRRQRAKFFKKSLTIMRREHSMKGDGISHSVLSRVATFSFFGKYRRALYDKLVTNGALRYLVAIERHFVRRYQCISGFNFLDYVDECIVDRLHSFTGISLRMWLTAICAVMLVGLWHDLHFVASCVAFGISCVFIGKLCWIMHKIEKYEREGEGELTEKDFWFSNPNLIGQVYPTVTFVNSFQVAYWICVAWQVDPKNCYLTDPPAWKMAVQVITTILSLIMGIFIILPADTLVSQCGGSMPSGNILQKHLKSTMQALDHALNKRRTQKSRTFKTQDQAVLHIQKTWKERKLREADKDASALVRDSVQNKGGKFSKVGQLTKANTKLLMKLDSTKGKHLQPISRSASQARREESSVAVEVEGNGNGSGASVDPQHEHHASHPRATQKPKKLFGLL